MQAAIMISLTRAPLGRGTCTRPALHLPHPCTSTCTFVSNEHKCAWRETTIQNIYGGCCEPSDDMFVLQQYNTHTAGIGYTQRRCVSMAAPIGKILSVCSSVHDGLG